MNPPGSLDRIARHTASDRPQPGDAGQGSGTANLRPVPRSPTAGPRSAAAAPREVRIIGGTLRRSRLPVLDRPGLRPTPDRVRETLFNWLGQRLDGWHCLDLFAGSGALGFEAASRGAATVLLCEQDAGVAAALEATRRRLGVDRLRVHRGDALALPGLAMPPGGWHLVFIDPPWALPLAEPALRAARAALAADGRIYLEAPERWDAPRLAPLGLVLLRHLKAGAVHAHLLAPDGTARPDPPAAAATDAGRAPRPGSVTPSP